MSLSDDDAAAILGTLGMMHTLYGKQPPPPQALLLLLEDIEGFGAEVIGKALQRLRLTYDGRAPITSALLASACESAAGRLSPEEAWALALTARDEEATVIWTDEIEQAWWGAAPLLRGRADFVGARFAFVEIYTRVCHSKRERGQLPRVTASLGTNKRLQAEAVEQARARGLDVSQLVGTNAGEVLALAHVPARGEVLQLSDESAPAEGESAPARAARLAKEQADQERMRANLRHLRDVMAGAPAARAAMQDAQRAAELQDFREKKAAAQRAVDGYHGQASKQPTTQAAKHTSKQHAR